MLDQLSAHFERAAHQRKFAGQLAVMKHGLLLLSLCAGEGKATGGRIASHSLFPVLSATKGIASMVMLHLHHFGYFDWHDLIAKHWPAFGGSGKHAATIADALSHRLGVPYVTANWRHWTDRRYMAELVENARPDWPPGQCYGYHGGSWGIVVDELVRRLTGSTTGEVLRDLIPDAADGCYIGLPTDRYGDVVRVDGFPPNEAYNSKDILTSCQSSGGGVASAEGLAAAYNLLAHRGQLDGRILWTEAEQLEATRPLSDSSVEQPVARPELGFSWGYGFMVPPSPQVFGSSPSVGTAGHPGASGAIGWADPDSGLAVGMTTTGIDTRAMYQQFEAIGDLLRYSLHE